MSRSDPVEGLSNEPIYNHLDISIIANFSGLNDGCGSAKSHCGFPRVGLSLKHVLILAR